jgi:thymidylate synthase (FAD)
MRIKVLDYGFVTLRNISGPTRREGDFDADDIDPANAARMSFDMTDSDRTRDQDLKLCKYLMQNGHTSPFEMVEVWLEMKLPIFVARQFVRHRTTSINEVSGRYVKLPAEWYIPKLEDVVIQTPNKKQGGRPIDLNNPDEVGKANRYLERLSFNCEQSYRDYLLAIDDGIAMEQARLELHLNHYTHWLWKQDLHNLMHFLSLRDHGHAQGEPQQYAKAVDALVRGALPNCMNLYDQFRRRA